MDIPHIQNQHGDASRSILNDKSEAESSRFTPNSTKPVKLVTDSTQSGFHAFEHNNLITQRTTTCLKFHWPLEKNEIYGKWSFRPIPLSLLGIHIVESLAWSCPTYALLTSPA